MAMACADCGVRSDLGEELFARVRRSLRRQAHAICPRCHHERQAREAGGLVRSAAGLLLVSVALLHWRPELTAGWVALYAALFSAFFHLVVLPHELGHALAARLLGMRLFGVTLGTGWLRRRWRVAGLRLDWRGPPSGGFTHAGPARAEGARWRMAALAVAGPAANVLLALAVWPWLPEPGAWETWRTPVAAAASAWVGCHGVAALASLWPHRVVSAQGIAASDGLLALQALFSGVGTVRGWLLACCELEVAGLRAERRAEEALARIADTEAAWGAAPELATLRGVLLVDLGRLDEARRVFLDQLEREPTPIERIVVLSNLAWCAYLSQRDELFEEAEAASDEAMRSLGWLAPVQGTRAAVLVWSERAEDALPLLDRAFDGAEDARDRACVAGIRARAHHQLGHPDQAKHHLEQARHHDPACPLL